MCPRLPSCSHEKLYIKRHSSPSLLHACTTKTPPRPRLAAASFLIADDKPPKKQTPTANLAALPSTALTAGRRAPPSFPLPRFEQRAHLARRRNELALQLHASMNMAIHAEGAVAEAAVAGPDPAVLNSTYPLHGALLSPSCDFLATPSPPAQSQSQSRTPQLYPLTRQLRPRYPARSVERRDPPATAAAADHCFLSVAGRLRQLSCGEQCKQWGGEAHARPGQSGCAELAL